MLLLLANALAHCRPDSALHACPWVARECGVDGAIRHPAKRSSILFGKAARREIRFCLGLRVCLIPGSADDIRERDTSLPCAFEHLHGIQWTAAARCGQASPLTYEKQYTNDRRSRGHDVRPGVLHSEGQAVSPEQAGETVRDLSSPVATPARRNFAPPWRFEAPRRLRDMGVGAWSVSRRLGASGGLRDMCFEAPRRLAKSARTRLEAPRRSRRGRFFSLGAPRCPRTSRRYIFGAA